MPGPSELKRRLGIRLKRRYGLIRCKCKSHLIVAQGQKRRVCPYCGQRSWLHDRHVVLQSDDLKLLQKLKAGTGNYYFPNGFITADRLLRSPSVLGPFAPGWGTRSNRPGPGRHRESVVT